MADKNTEYQHKDIKKVDVLGEIQKFVKGAVKGNTTDLVGAPVDLLNIPFELLSKNSESTSDPAGGSKFFRQLLGMNPEDENLSETAGTLVSAGGLSKAMIVPFMALAKKAGRTVEQQRTAQNMVKRLTEEGIVNPDAVFNLLKGYVETNKKGDVNVKGFISDASSQINTKNLDAFTNSSMKERQALSKKMNSDNPEEAKQAERDYWKVVAKEAGKEMRYKSTNLENILQHEELYQMFPELRKMKITEMEPTSPNYGELQIRKKKDGTKSEELFINLYQHDYDPNKIKETLLHEVQHSIQRNTGFDLGGNVDQFVRPKIENALREQKALAKTPEEKQKLDLLERNLQEVYFRQYRNIPGEQEARFTEATTNLTQTQGEQFLMDILKKGKTPTSWATR
jgi:hypothetical protein